MAKDTVFDTYLREIQRYDLLTADEEKALAAGCDDYDTKPVQFKRLLEKIGKYVDGG